ncbi:protein FAM161A-like [Anneissia japonica]|uniref:protein FAM161A-like n=1 Tax=Anneissia japonica TaxID=1529436 RepID=UPI001425A7F1|nr:protein FAM161A-like [Anneissia japonica]
MATAHSLSVVTNSCIKTPLNPKTKLAATLDEREDSLYQSWGTQNDFGAHNGEGNKFMEKSPAGNDSPRSVDFSTADGMIKSLTNDLGNLSDADFYAKLTELRQEHRRTLGLFETMYNDKLKDECKDEFDFERSPAPSFSRGHPVYVGDHKLHHINDEIEAYNKSQPSWSALNDNLKDMSASKPPTGRTRSAWSGSRHKQRSHRRSGSVSGDEFTNVALSSSRNLSRSSESLSFCSSATHSRLQSSRSSTPVAMVEDMWEDFSLEDYMPRARSVASSKSSTSKRKDWSPKITIPKPFKMTQRDECKERTKSRTLLEHEQEQLEKEKEIEAVCSQKFTATPVPGHTYLPLFDEIMERQEERRRRNQELSKEVLKSTEKPFTFIKRETDKKQNQRKPFKSIAPKPKKKQFKANPVPKEMLNSSIDEKIAEEEEYRKIRIKMRAEELLRQSALPPNMQVKGKEYTDGKMRQKMYKKREKNAFITSEHKFRPNINGDVPDYEELHWKFKMKLDKEKQVKEPTVVEPFNLRTARIPSKKDKVLMDITKDEETLTEQRWPYLSSRSSVKFSHGSINIPDDAIPTKTTHTSSLRDSLKQKRKEEEIKKRQDIMEKEKEKQMRERKLKRFIAEKAMANDNSSTLESTQKDKLRRHREADRERKEEYEQELREMLSRVESRPLLFERESTINAKRKAERKYQQALLEAGIEEDFLLRKSRGQVSVGQVNGIDDTNEEDDDEYTYSFDRNDEDDYRYMRSKDESSYTSDRHGPSKTEDSHDGLSPGERTPSSIHSEDIDDEEEEEDAMANGWK